jgi:Xaa-Pro dipeptidase
MRRALCLLALSLASTGIWAVAWAHPPASVPPRSSVADSASRRVAERPLDELQITVGVARLDGWLLCDYRGQDPRAVAIVRPQGMVTQRWCYLVPPSGEPQLMVSQGDLGAFEQAPGSRLVYRNWRQREVHLKALVRGRKRVAIDLGRIDGATIDLVRGAGVTLVPSDDLVTQVLGRWGGEQRASHARALARLLAVKDEAFRLITERVTGGDRVNEYEVQQLVVKTLPVYELETERAVVIAAGPNSADPQYVPSGRRSSPIRPGDLVRLEVAARERETPDAVYAELVWMGVVGDAAPARAQAAFAAVKAARERAIALLAERRQRKQPVVGWEVDAAVRAVLEKAGFNEPNVLPVGRSLGRTAEGEGPQLDDTETHDERQILARTAYSLAPGVFIEGQFGVRSGVNVFVGDEGVEALPDPPQMAIEPLLVKSAVVNAKPRVPEGYEVPPAASPAPAPAPAPTATTTTVTPAASSKPATSPAASSVRAASPKTAPAPATSPVRARSVRPSR